MNKETIQVVDLIEGINEKEKRADSILKFVDKDLFKHLLRQNFCEVKGKSDNVVVYSEVKHKRKKVQPIQIIGKAVDFKFTLCGVEKKTQECHFQVRSYFDNPEQFKFAILIDEDKIFETKPITLLVMKEFDGFAQAKRNVNNAIRKFREYRDQLEIEHTS